MRNICFVALLIANVVPADLFALFTDPPGCPSTESSATNSVAQAILDPLAGPPVTLRPVVSTVALPSTVGRITDVDVVLNISHTFPGDLDIQLTAPSGRVVTLTTDNGGTNDNVFNGTLFDDQAGQVNPPGAVSDTTFALNVVEATVAPEEPLASFIGEDPEGTWTLTIVDDARIDVGNLVSWTLRVRTCSIPPLQSQATNIPATMPAPVTIPDAVPAGLSLPLVVSGVGSNLCGLQLFTNITHPSPADLDITLISPAGSEVTVSTDNGSGFADVFAGTTWLDVADDTVTDHIYSSNTVATPLSPEEPFSVFSGQNPNGQWVLKLVDDSGGGEIGAISAWSLNVVTCSNAPDSDGDGVGDSVDNCRTVSNSSQFDFDSDGAGDSCDSCLSDPLKSDPGDCGCGQVDIDSDGDTEADCIDSCPLDALKVSSGVCGCGVADINSDGDSALNCLEACPLDATKLSPGVCGCGIPDIDQNKNKIVDCQANSELRLLLTQSLAQVRKLKVGQTLESQKKLNKKIGSLLSSLSKLVAAPGGVLATRDGSNVPTAVTRVRQAIKKSLNTANAKFAKNKRKAIAAIIGLNSVLQ